MGLHVQVEIGGDQYFFFFFKWLKLNSSMKRTCELISWWPSKSIHKRGPGEATGGGKCPVGSAAFPERG